jgi:hypothetical protein
MSASIIVFSGIIIAMFAVASLLVVHSMRKYTSKRADTEQRAAEAFAEMQRVTRELRERGGAPVPADLKPGERLQQMYPGVRPARPAGVEEG